jgi:chemotaxis protein MotB
MLTVCALGLLLASGCEPAATEGMKEENQRLKDTILGYEQQSRDLMAQVEQSEVRFKQLQLDLQGKDRKIKELYNGIDTLRNQTVLLDKVKRQLEILARDLGGRLTGNRLELPGDFFFDSGSYSLRKEAEAALKELADILKGRNLTLLIVGHTDSDPINKSKRRGISDNRHLSCMRALSVLGGLKKTGYPEELMYPTGWGAIHPLDNSGTKAGKAINRRVEILIDPAANQMFGNVGITGVTGPTDGGGAVEVEE